MSQRQKVILVLAVLFCTFFQVLPVVRSGLNYSYGTGFWGPTGHDGIWHLSLITHISSPFNIPLPSFSGETLKNYHPFFDILLSVFSRISLIPAHLWLFQIAPILMSLVFSWFSFQIGRLLTKKYWGGLTLLFINTFANSFGWIVTLFKSGSLAGESLFWSMQSFSNQLNPPFMLSLVFLSILIWLLLKPKSKFSSSELFIIFILLTFIPVTKAYAAVPAFILVSVFSIPLVLKKDFSLLSVALISLLTASGIFLIYNPKSAGLFVFQPFWFINSMIDSPDRLFIPKLASARYNLELRHLFSFKLIAIYISTFIIFFIGNFGWRSLFLFGSHSRNKLFHNALILSIVALVLIPTFFIQKGTSWNTIQFMYYALFLANILLIDFLFKIKSKPLFLFLSSLIISTSFISNLASYREYLSPTSSSYITPQENICLSRLTLQKPGTVLTYPYDPYLRQSLSSDHGLPLYAYETTSYVSAYTPHNIYVADTMNLNNSGYDWNTRLDASQKFFNQKNIYQDRGFLVNNRIDYIYLVGSQTKIPLNPGSLYLKKLFENTDCLIYQVQR
ncbi:MAG TPA: hypothetical protein VF828_01980 [Patescibacteria group bacterium]